MYLTHNEGKSVDAERFIRTLKNKIYKRMTAVSKNVYFNFLDDIVDKYNNTYHRAIKIKPIDVKSDYCDVCNIDSNSNLKLVIMQEFQNTKTFLLTGWKKFL